MTREFILLALRAPTTSEFSFENMPLEGRMDLVCRCISNSLYVSFHAREDTIIYVCLNGAPSELSPKIISFDSSKLRGMEMDERSVATFIKKALEDGKNLKMGEEKEVQEGLIVSKKAFETLVKEKSEEKNKQLVYLEEYGTDIREFNFNLKKDLVFIFGDFKGIPKNTEKLLKRLEFEPVSLGPVILLASHCPVIVHNELDRLVFNK